jgi:hypothetical protein
VHIRNLKGKEKEIFLKYLEENNEKEYDEEHGDLQQLIEDSFVINKENDEENSEDLESKFEFEQADLSVDELEEEDEEILVMNDNLENAEDLQDAGKRKRRKSSKFYGWKESTKNFPSYANKCKKNTNFVFFFNNSYYFIYVFFFR